MDDATVMFHGISQLLQAVPQELQEPDHVLIPHEHRNTAQRAATLPLRQLPVYPPDSEGVPEADLGRLPPDGEKFLVPNPPDPARLQPFGELLGFGHVSLHVAGRLFPSPHGYNTSPSVEMPF